MVCDVELKFMFGHDFADPSLCYFPRNMWILFAFRNRSVSIAANCFGLLREKF